MFKKYLPICILALSGCSTLNYDEPTGGELAKVRFVTDSSDVVVLWRYDDVNCSGETEWLRLRNGFLLNSSPKSLNMPLSDGLHKNAYKELYVESGIEHVFMFKGTVTEGLTEYSCGVPIKMNFENDAMYEINFQNYGTTCNAILSEVYELADGEPRKKPLETFTNSVYGFGEQCKEAFDQLRLY